jgi:hypothetical protein
MNSSQLLLSPELDEVRMGLGSFTFWNSLYILRCSGREKWFAIMTLKLTIVSLGI